MLFYIDYDSIDRAKFKSFLNWSEVFNDHVPATTILDRLLHDATTLNVWQSLPERTVLAVRTARNRYHYCLLEKGDGPAKYH
jgi:hypothetical protein